MNNSSIEVQEKYSCVEITTVAYISRPHETRILKLTPELDGKTVRQILSELWDNKDVTMIDIHDGNWHEDASHNEVLDTKYIHFGRGFKKTNHESVCHLDLQWAANISSAGGLRVLAR
jgi:hypothetical protein